jgi:hypothetical protein
MSDILEPRRFAGILPAKKPLFFNVYAYHQFQMEFASGWSRLERKRFCPGKIPVGNGSSISTPQLV